MKNKFMITKITWLDEDVKEASVTFTKNGNSYTFFSYPCDFKEGQESTVELSALIFDNKKTQIIWDKKVSCYLSVTNMETWSYHGIGKIISKSPILIDFDGIIIDFEDEIHDTNLSVGSYIELDIGRMDGIIGVD